MEVVRNTNVDKAINDIRNDIRAKNGTRNSILTFEDILKQQENVIIGDSDDCPLFHKFADGIYVREIFIPAGMVLTGKIHKHAHPNFLLRGEVEVYTEYGGFEHFIAPMSMISQAGTKRIVKTLTDTVWVTIHLNLSDTQDLKQLEKEIIAPSYEAYDKFVEEKKGWKAKLKSRLIKFLS